MSRDPSPPGMLAPDEPRLWSVEAWRAMAARIVAMATGGGATSFQFHTRWSGNVRWARNRISTSGDKRANILTLTRSITGAAQFITLNQLDDAALRAAMAWVEQAIQLYRPEVFDMTMEPPFQAEDYLQPVLWAAATYDLDGSHRTAAAQASIERAEQAGLLSAGYLEVSGEGQAVYKPWQAMDLYYPVTEAQYSVMVRNAEGTASGWAGVNWNDWARIDVGKIAAIAVEKCLASRNPVAVEPGRYTVILEPQAVYDFGRSINAFMYDWNDIGTQLVDQRLSFSANPMDPDLGFVPFSGDGEPYRPAVWIAQGVLRHVHYDRRFAVENGLGNLGLLKSNNYRMDGGKLLTSVAEMVATTKRGLLVTRFYNVRIQDLGTLMSTGYTRDGLWLIENGRISKAVKNFRFTESPRVAFNNVEQIGMPQRVFAPGVAVVVPPIKIRDFNMTSLVDAV